MSIVAESINVSVVGDARVSLLPFDRRSLHSKWNDDSSGCDATSIAVHAHHAFTEAQPHLMNKNVSPVVFTHLMSGWQVRWNSNNRDLEIPINNSRSPVYGVFVVASS